MLPGTQSHPKIESHHAGSRNCLATILKRVNVLSKVVPTTAGSRRTLNITLLVVVLPLLLLGVALVNFLRSSTFSAVEAIMVDPQQLDQAMEEILTNQAQALASMAADPTLISAVSVEGDIKSQVAGAEVGQRLDQLLQSYSGFESLALVNAKGELAAIAGILHQDFYLWQNTPAFYDSLNNQGRPSISPMKFDVLSLDEDGKIDLSNSRIERLVFTAGVAERPAGSKPDGLIVGIVESDTLVSSLGGLVHQNPGPLGIPGDPGPLFPDRSTDNAFIKSASPGTQLLLMTSGEVASVSPEVPLESTVQDTGSNDDSGSNPTYSGLSPFEETGTSWYSALPAQTARRSTLVMGNNLSLVLVAGSLLLVITAAWFIIRAPRNPRPKMAALGHISSLADAPGPNTYIDARKASQRLVVVQETVRREMANYLHGHVQSKLVALSLSLGMCQTIMTSKPDQASVLLEQVQGELQKVQDEDLRRVSHELYPAIVKMGLVPAMRSLINRFNESLVTDLIIDADVFAMDADGDTQLPEKQRLGVYRIAEEALNNALKHSHASHIEVTLIRNGMGELELTVTDDGCGFDADDESDSLGLAMMSDYAKAIGGQTKISTSPGQGTTVSLALSPNLTAEPVPYLPEIVG